MLVACLLSFVASAVLYPGYIKWLKKRQVEQFLREDGPQSHAHKAKTPTMGGLVFGIVTSVVSLTVLAAICPSAKPLDTSVILVALICGGIGFLDDFAKFRQKSNKGISGYVRLGSELVLGLILGAAIVMSSRELVFVPFAEQVAAVAGGHAASFAGTALGIWGPPALLFVPLAGFLIAATANSLNLHDGMDGLAAGTSCQVFAALALMLFATGQVSLALVAASAAGALCGFILFNKNPAQIFMGDTGSLFIGGLMGALVVAGGLVVWFVPLSLVYIFEALSVMVQVTVFKLTKKLEGEEKMNPAKVIITKLTKRLPGEGKRVFRMAPLHHHYEAIFAEKGVPEWRVVAGFWVAQTILCLATCVLFFTYLK
jgi:phospho-N-acetylmuramoyl-pentapeptide-transferase